MNTLAEPGPYASVWDSIRAHLDAARRAVMREIRFYPQPIAGCDAQIPVLWERRDALGAELARLAAAAHDPAPEAVVSFLAASPVIAEADRQRFLDRLAGLRTAAPAPRKSAAEQAGRAEHTPPY